MGRTGPTTMSPSTAWPASQWPPGSVLAPWFSAVARTRVATSFSRSDLTCAERTARLTYAIGVSPIRYSRYPPGDWGHLPDRLRWLRGPAITDIKDAQIRDRFNLGAWKGPTITEIDSAPLRARHRLNRRVDLILSQSPSTDI